MKQIKAPEDYSEYLDKYTKHQRIFLAGSIEMGTADNWQKQVVKTMKPYRGLIFNPLRKDWDSSWEQSISCNPFVEQVQWEQQAIADAGIVFFYFQPGTQSPISLLEFGQVCFDESKYVVVCCPDGFWRKGNLEVVCDNESIPLYHNFEDATDTLQNLMAGHIKVKKSKLKKIYENRS